MEIDIDIKKYLATTKRKKKAYTLSLNEDAIKFLRGKLKVPISYIINEFLEDGKN